MSGFIQKVCPKCGSYVIAPFNSETPATTWECFSLACGWKGNYPSEVRITTTDNTSIEGDDINEESRSHDCPLGGISISVLAKGG